MRKFLVKRLTEIDIREIRSMQTIVWNHLLTLYAADEVQARVLRSIATQRSITLLGAARHPLIRDRGNSGKGPSRQTQHKSRHHSFQHRAPAPLACTVEEV